MSVGIPKPEGLSQRRKLVPQKGSKTSTDDDSKVDDVRVRNIYRLFNTHDAPIHLMFNPYIHSGYRGYLPLKTCVQSVFWWTNETVNIWSHVFGFWLFLGFAIRDLYILSMYEFPLKDTLIITFLLIGFMVTMALSTLYHTFSCHSEKVHDQLLKLDIFGITVSMGTIYVAAIYYGFICTPILQHSHLVVIVMIFLVVAVVLFPGFEFGTNVRNLTFFLWGSYGLFPTIHWAYTFGGLEQPIVVIFLIRLLELYALALVSFVVYFFKVPERIFSGKFDLVGASHQVWHCMVVVILYHCHNTGMMYIQLRINTFCPDHPLYNTVSYNTRGSHL